MAGEVNIGELIESLLKEGKSEDVIFNDISKTTGKGIIAAVRSYKSYMKESGRTMSTEDRKTKIKELLDPLVKDGEIDSKTATSMLVNELDISTQAAKSNIKKYCAANEIELPTREALSKQTVEAYSPAILSMFNDGAKKKDIVAAMVKEEKIEEKIAHRILRRVLKDNGLVAGRAQHDSAAVSTFIKTNMADDVTKADFSTGLEEEFSMTPSAARKFFDHWKFARVFAG